MHSNFVFVVQRAGGDGHYGNVRHAWTGADHARGLKTAQHGHRKIGQDQIDLLAVQRIQGFLFIGGQQAAVAACGEDALDQDAVGYLVFNE